MSAYIYREKDNNGYLNDPRYMTEERFLTCEGELYDGSGFTTQTY